jgi:hypothetical protein
MLVRLYGCVYGMVLLDDDSEESVLRLDAEDGGELLLFAGS